MKAKTKAARLLALGGLAVLGAALCWSQGFQVEEMGVETGCGYSGPIPAGRVYMFAPDQRAEDEIEKIVGVLGLRANFQVRSADVENAVAIRDDQGQRWILYSQSFMEEMYRKTGTRWAATAILAHEVGHHLNNDPLPAAESGKEIHGDCSECRHAELGADAFCGRALYLLGCDELQEAQAAMDLLASNRDTNTHPRKSARLAAIANGWISARQQFPRREGAAEPAWTPEPTPYPTPRPAPRPTPAPRGHRTGDIETLDLGGGVAMNLVWIEPGTFTMGSPSSEEGRDDNEGPQTRVTLTEGFWMGQTEVTQAQWKAVMGSNPSHFKGADIPEIMVSWEDAMEFCQKLSRKAGRDIGLPTEAQWEYACRGGTTGRFSFGNSDSQLGDYAWHNGNSDWIEQVGQKRPNPWGLYDMHGNVYEWCADWYDSDAYPGGSLRNPGVLTNSGSDRVIRGGSCGDYPLRLRSARRKGAPPAGSFGNVGFRIRASSAS